MILFKFYKITNLSLLGKNIIASLFSQGFLTFLTFLFTPLFIKILGVEAYGLVAFYTLIYAWVSLLDMGLMPTVNREIAILQSTSQTKKLFNFIRTFEYIYIISASIILVLIVSNSKFIAIKWINTTNINKDTVFSSIMLMGLIIFFKWIEQLYRVILLGFQDHVWVGYYNAAVSLFTWGGGYLIIFYFRDIINFFKWQLFVSTVFCVFIILRLYTKNKINFKIGKFDLAIVNNIKGYASKMFLSSILVLLLTQSDKLIISKLVSFSNFTVYTLAFSVAAALGQISTPIIKSVFPFFAGKVANNQIEDVVEVYFKYSEILAAILFTSVATLFLFTNQILFFWIGNVSIVQQVSPILKILAIGMLCNNLIALPYNIQLSYGWVNLSNILNIFSVLIYLPTIYFLIPLYGTIASAYMWLIINFVYMVLSIEFMHTRIMINHKKRWYFFIIILPSFLTIFFSFIFSLIANINYDGPFKYLMIFFYFILLISIIISANKFLKKRYFNKIC